MRQITIIDRLALLVTGLLAAYQVAIGIDGLEALPTLCYTIAFGVLLVSGLLLIIFGFEILDSQAVVIVAAAIPLSLSLGLVSEYLPSLTRGYLAFVVLGFLALAATRWLAPKKIATFTLATVHGIAGLTIFGLPLVLALNGMLPLQFGLVGVGGGLIGVGGILLAFLRAGRPILPARTIYAVLPGLLLLMTGAFLML